MEEIEHTEGDEVLMEWNWVDVVIVIAIEFPSKNFTRTSR